jgi:hypothetical protein
MWWSELAWGAPVAPGNVSVAAKGEQSSVFTITEFGRFAVTATSGQGTAVRVEDRMAGVLDANGVPGEVDGRVDLFLDRGQVKVVAESHPEGTGQVQLSVRPFAQVAPPVQLLPARRVDTTLRDFEARSWWVDAPDGGPVSIEAAGRFLGDLRLWRDGVWLVDAVPSCRTIEPVAGAPWQDCVLSTTLEPGVYLASAYGAPGQPWTTDDPTAAALEVQWGVPTLADFGVQRGELPPSGFLRLHVPRGAHTLFTALPDVAPFRLVGGMGGEPTITTESRRPTAYTRADDTTVSLVGAPGQPYALTWFQEGTTRSVTRPATYWVGSLSTGHPSDVLEPTGIVTGSGPVPGQVWKVAAQAVTLSSTTSFAEQFNVDATARSVLVEVVEDGPYHFTVTGAPASLQLVPYLHDWPAGMQKPPPASGSLQIELAPGLYQLTVSGAPGPASLTMGYDSLAARAQRALGAGPPPQVRRQTVQFPVLPLDKYHEVRLFAGAASGLFVRELPLDPAEALPVSLLPSEVIDVPIRVASRGRLEFLAPDGSPFPLSVDGGPLGTEHDVAEGEHQVRVVNPRSQPELATLQLTPAARAPLQPLDPARLATLDAFPKLRADRPIGVDLADQVPRTVRLVVDEAALYLVESTGLLATTGTLRTRTVPSLSQDSQSGDGRNFQLARFLRPGDYQLTAVADGASAGHAGLRLRKGVVREGGDISDDTPARVTLQPTEAVRHALVVEKEGDFHVVHRGRTRVFDCRLEDAAGWTVTGVPDQTCDVYVHLTPGRYVLVGLPDRVESRRHTVVERVEPGSLVRTGHGPFPLPLSEGVTATWTEPRAAEARPVDVWQGELPAEVEVSFELSAEMTGRVFAGEREVATLAAGRGWRGVLPRGPVRVEVQAARKGTGVPYHLSLWPTPLVTGVSRSIALGEAVDVVVAEPGVYTFESDGFVDVRARLLGADGRVVAANDDRPDDWNFRMSTRLDPGGYQLRVSPVSGEGGDDVRVSMRAPKEVDGGALRDGTPRALRPGRDAWVLGLDRGKEEVVVATATSRENVGVALEVQGDDGWRGVAVGTGTRAVAVARVGDRPVRVRVWSEDGRGGEVTAEAFALKPRGNAVALGKGWGAVSFGGGAGQFVVRDASAGTWVCGVPGGCRPGGDGVVDAPAEGLILVREGGSVSADRVQLADGESVTLRVGERREVLDLEPGDGPVVVEVRGASGTLGAQVAGAENPVLVSGSASLAIGAAGGKAVTLWGQGLEDLDARVVLHALSPARPEPAADGAHTFAVPAGGAVSLALPAARHLRLDLERGLAVTTGDGRGAWAERDATAVHLRSATGPVLFVNPTDAERLVHADVLPASGGAVLVVGEPHEGVHPAAETWVMPVPASPGRLVVRGTARAHFVGSEGQIRTEAPFDVGAGGVLTLAVTPGPVLAWVESAPGAGPSRATPAGATTRVTGAQAVWLTGARVGLELAPAAASAVSLRAPCPLVATVAGGRVVVLDAGERLDTWVADPARPVPVELRALAGTALYGELATSASVPAALGEGLGPETLLGPGGSAWYTVDVAREGLVGFGARADAERVDVVLYDAAGAELARGLVASRTLSPGRYLLALSQPPGSAPVRARPVVVGLVEPPSGPPEDVVRSYFPSTLTREVAP